MSQDNRPLETLAAYALTFVSGMVAMGALSIYTKWVQRQARAEASSEKG
jgi:hypothetical protein